MNGRSHSQTSQPTDGPDAASAPASYRSTPVFDAATLPADTFKALVKHPLTDKGLDAFVKDWKSTGQSIL